ncbi:MAG: adenylate/guanylate cyclase domain-containing protein [Alphaproteobacteria bacterium]
MIEALRCAIEVQRGMTARNATVPAERRIRFRIGINLGDIIEQDGDLLGDGVNVAARLEGPAEPGGICLSRAARDQVRDRLDVRLDDRGEVEVKNIARPVRVFSELADGEAPRPRARQRAPRLLVLTVAAVVLTILAAGGLWWWQPWVERVEPADVARMAYPLPDKPSIAVLPFGNLSDDAGQDFFAAGITDDIITDLSKVSGLFVTAAHATKSFKGKDASNREVSEALGVRYVLSGSVRRDGERVRITAQLADVLGGNHIWSNRYDRELVDVFAVQSEVTKRAVTAMEVTLKAREQDRVY